MRPEAFFLPIEGNRENRRFCLFHAAQGGRTRGSVIHVHAFAEEMNKARRMVALQSRALSAGGYAVLQIDLLGCGDSDGDFGDATWDAWVNDILVAVRWLEEHSTGPLWLWGLRVGCLLAAEAAQRLPRPSNFLFWQPPPSGKPLLQQFLRLGLASDLLEGKVGATTQALRQRLDEGSRVEIAGYSLAPALAQGLERSRLEPPARVGRVEWIDVSTSGDVRLGPASAEALELWRTRASHNLHRGVTGPSFWQTTEIEEAPALIAASNAALIQDGST